MERLRIEESGESRFVIASQHEGQCMLEIRREMVGRCRGSSDMTV